MWSTVVSGSLCVWWLGSVKDRMEAAMAATRREGNKLKKGLGAKLEAIYDAQTENCECRSSLWAPSIMTGRAKERMRTGKRDVPELGRSRTATDAVLLLPRCRFCVCVG